MYRTQKEIDEMYEAVRQCKAEGLSVRETAALLKVTDATVYRYRKGFVGVRLRDYGEDRRMTLTPQQVEELRQLRESGATYAELCSRYRISYTCVCYWLNERYRQSVIKNAKERADRLRLDPEYRKDYYKRTNEQMQRRNRLLKKITKEETK
jgi:predicted transcriptional regulator